MQFWSATRQQLMEVLMAVLGNTWARGARHSVRAEVKQEGLIGEKCGVQRTDRPIWRMCQS
jgi:hypothetical protein